MQPKVSMCMEKCNNYANHKALVSFVNEKDCFVELVIIPITSFTTYKGAVYAQKKLLVMLPV